MKERKCVDQAYVERIAGSIQTSLESRDDGVQKDCTTARR